MQNMATTMSTFEWIALGAFVLLLLFVFKAGQWHALARERRRNQREGAY